MARVTFNIESAAAEAVAVAKGSFGMNTTDALNAGLRLLKLYADTVAQDGRLQIRHADGEVETIRFL